MSRWFPALYYVKSADLGKNRPFETAIHKTRDGLALWHLSEPLAELGYHFGSAILNIPKSVMAELRKRTKLTESACCPSVHDLVLLATRPPLSDMRNRKPGGRTQRGLERSGEFIEQDIHDSLGKVFAECQRSRVALTECAKLTEGDNNLLDIQFRVRAMTPGDAAGAVLYFNGDGKKERPTNSRVTVGYVVGIPSVGRSRFRLVAAFGMGGTETLWLSCLLRGTLRQVFKDAVNTKTPFLRLILFEVPRVIPFPVFDTTAVQFAERVVEVDVTKCF